MLCGTHIEIWNLAKHMKKQNKTVKILDLLMKKRKLRVWCYLFHFFHVICKISNFNMWTAKHLAKASCTELTLLGMYNFAGTLPNFWTFRHPFNGCASWLAPRKFLCNFLRRPRATSDKTRWRPNELCIEYLVLFVNRTNWNRTNRGIPVIIKFSFPEKATKICAIFFMVLTLTNNKHQTMRKIVQIFDAFSEKLNFNNPLISTESTQNRRNFVFSSESSTWFTNKVSTFCFEVSETVTRIIIWHDWKCLLNSVV